MEKKEEFVLHNLAKYNIPTNNDTCVALCYFNPVGYKNLYENLNIVLKSLKDSNIPYFIIELIYPNQTSSVKDAFKVVKANTVVFSKENLWNILEKYIPSKYSKIIFIDADIKFTNPDWFNLSSQKLDTCDIIQPMDIVFRDLIDKESDTSIITTDMCRYSVAFMMEHSGEACSFFHHPGFAVGINREMFHKIGGFFEYGISGNGDTLFWMAIANFYSTAAGKYLRSRKDISIKYYDYRAHIERLNIRIGATVDNMAVHLFHGSIDNRKYLERDKYINTSLYDNFYHNDNGVLEMINDDSVYRYFIERKEDD